MRTAAVWLGFCAWATAAQFEMSLNVDSISEGTIGGCEIKLSLLKDQVALEIRGRSALRVDFSARTCEGEFEVGVPQEEVLKWDRDHMESPTEAPRTMAFPYITSAGYLYVGFVDPIGLTVNWVTNYLTWYWRPYPLALWPSATIGYDEYWRTGTGWYRDYSDYGGVFGGIWIGNQSNASFSNFLFPACLGGTATVRYNSITVYGWITGDLTKSGSWTINWSRFLYLSPISGNETGQDAELTVSRSAVLSALSKGPLVLCLAVSCAFLVAPSYTPQATMLSVNGIRGLLALALPVLLSAVPFVYPRGGRLASVALMLFALLTDFGLYYLPSAVLLVISQWRRSPGNVS